MTLPPSVQPAASGQPHGRADDRDDSSKTTPATDMQADDALSPGLSEDLGTEVAPVDHGQAPADRRERESSGIRAHKAPKREGGTGEDR